MFGFLYFGEAQFAGQPFFSAGTAIIPIPTPVVVITLKAGDGGAELRKKREEQRRLVEQREAAQNAANEEDDIELILSVWLNLH